MRCWGASLWTQSRYGDGWPARNGCAVEGPSTWSRAVFANLDCLPQSEQARWCVWKSAELLYLLSAPEGNALNVLPVPALDRGGSPGFRKDAPLYGGSPGRSPDHPSPEPHGHALRHNIQGCFPPSVRPAGPRLAAAAADGNGRQSCCGTPPSVFWGWLSQSDMAVPASSPPPSAGSTV